MPRSRLPPAIARAQRIGRAGPSKLATNPSPVVLISRPAPVHGAPRDQTGGAGRTGPPSLATGDRRFLQPYDEGTLSRRVGTVCVDWAGTRRRLVEEGLMRREGGIYGFTALGEAVWRVEQFIRAAA